MERNIEKSPSDFKAGNEKSFTSNEEKNSDADNDNDKIKQKEVNSWDCSTPSSQGANPEKKTNDWDSSSECQEETMVEPFDGDVKDNWHSDESEHKSAPKFSFGRNGEFQEKFETSSDSLDLSIANLSDMDKNSLVDMFSITSGEKRKSRSLSKRSFMKSEDDLMLEDIEEFMKDENGLKMPSSKDNKQPTPTSDDSGTGSEKVRSNHSEGTPEDTTIWMIPKSERTQSADSTSKLMSYSDREKIEKLSNFQISIKKAKSLSDAHKCKTERKTSRSSRSDRLGLKRFDRCNLDTFLLKCEGSSLQKNLKTKTKKEGISGCENFDRTPVFFTEYECRAMTMDKDVPEKISDVSESVVSSPENTVPEVVEENSGSEPEKPDEGVRNSEETISEMVLAGPSTTTGTAMDVVSLPDMIGRNSLKEWPLKEKFVRRVSPTRGRTDPQDPKQPGVTRTNPINESWFLLDKTGQYQPVTKNEVTILLNGKSADAVLQGRKEHVIPNTSLGDPSSPEASISGILTKESLQYFLQEEDTGGEDNGKKLIDLERKVENTLLYIQPGMNLTASIRIIPVDTEMIHIWRRTRDSGSMLSSEVDLRHQTSQESVENPGQRNHRRMTLENSHHKLEELDETPPPEEAVEEPNSDLNPVQNSTTDYSSLLIETRMIVDSLTSNFKTLQNRLDGETNRSLALQAEVNKLRLLLKNIGGKSFFEKNFRETISEQHLFNSEVSSLASLLTVKAADKTDLKSESVIEEQSEVDPAFQSSTEIHQDQLECTPSRAGTEGTEGNSNTDDGCITVNIYTMEVSPSSDCVVKVQETNSLLQSNLGLIEGKMKRLQQENEVISKQNFELKKKLKEISLELEKYLASTSDIEPCFEEDIEMESLRDQVCNLKLELDNLKRLSFIAEDKLKSEKSLILEEYEKKSSCLEEWLTTAFVIFQEMKIGKSRLLDTGIAVDVNLDFETVNQPKNFMNGLILYLQEITNCLVLIRNQEKTIKEPSNDSKEMKSLDQVISGYSELIEQCRKGSGDTENKVMEDYFTVIMEKASLMEEIKILKTENEMLLEGQLEHYEKLKQTMIALKDRKSEITALESSQKLSEEEKNKMVEMLNSYELERKKIGAELLSKSKTIEELMLERKSREFELNDVHEKLKAAAGEIKNFEKSCRLKDELISEFRKENDKFLISSEIKDNEIQMLRNEINNLGMQKDELERHLSSTEVLLSESQKEMTEYISHLETLVNNCQESLEKTKQKLKESNQVINRYKSENDVLDQQHQCDLKLYNKTKDELETLKEKHENFKEKFNEIEEENEKLHKKLDEVSVSEKEKSEALNAASKECKILTKENASLKEKLEVYSKDKDESLKEQKDLINKYAMLSKEIQKLQEKYKNVKAECNERTDLIKYLETMLKENLLEYNARIACLEKNISHIIEKIAACKNCMKEKHHGVDAEVRELRHQLDVTYQERKELEHVVNNYYSLMKHLEGEIQERERKVDELHVKLSIEQQKAADYEIAREQSRIETPEDSEVQSSDCLKIEKLESQIAMAESELLECKNQLHNCQNDYENEKKKLELIIADLKSEINRYQIRIEVMMRNLSNYNKNINASLTDKRHAEDINLQSIKKDLQEKDKKISDLNEVINKYSIELKEKIGELENYKKENRCLDEELKNLHKQFSKLKDALLVSNQNTQAQQRERDEMADKLLQSIKLIMEEKSARQTIEALAAEKEKKYKDDLQKIKNESDIREKEFEIMSATLEDKKKLVFKLQEEIKKMKSEISSLKAATHKKKETRNIPDINQSPNIFPERLESILNELKEVRDTNLQLRKAEGLHQAKIVRLEDEIRDARLLIKELQGDIKTEKKSKKALKNMIVSAKMEIEKCLIAKQMISAVADKIRRHLDAAEVPSRELLSGFRLRDGEDSP